MCVLDDNQDAWLDELGEISDKQEDGDEGDGPQTRG